MKTHCVSLRHLLLAVAFSIAMAKLPSAEEPTEDQSAQITVAMEDCTASRPGKITGLSGAIGSLLFGSPKEQLVKRGIVTLDGTSYSLYLPKAKTYSVKNTGASDSAFENKSTLISVDQNGDAELADAEGWFANLPLRLGDRMLRVVEIADDGSRMVLRRLSGPLRGVIVGRTCPPFSYKTADGKPVTRDSLVGKTFILDIWSVT